MRVTQNMIDRNLIYSINDSYDRLSTLNQQISSGQRISTISDDVPGTTQVLRLQRQNDQIGVYMNNLSTADSVLSIATNSLANVSDDISRIKELAVQASTGTYTATDRQVMADGVNSLLNSILAAGEHEYNGAYVFSGESTHTTPFVATYGDDGQVQSVAYQGQAVNSEVAVGPHASSYTNYVGQDVFQHSTDLFGTVVALRDAIDNNDVDQINNLLGDLDDCHTDILRSQGILGERQSQLQVVRSAAGSIQQINSQVISDTKDADVTQVAVQYNSQMALLQMVLQVTAQAITPSLANFL